MPTKGGQVFPGNLENQRERVPTNRPFFDLKEIERELREALQPPEVLIEQKEKIPSEDLVKKRISPRKTTYRLRDKKDNVFLGLDLQASSEELKTQELQVRGKKPGLSFDAHGVAQGIIMSEILLPPRSKRPHRRG